MTTQDESKFYHVGITVKEAKPPTVQSKLLNFGTLLLFSTAGSVINDRLITPAAPLLPEVFMVLYQIALIIVGTLFLLGLVVAFFQVALGGWKHIVQKELRDELRQRIQSWPSSKWDLLPVIALTYFAATTLPLIVLIASVPQDRFVGTFTPEEARTLVLWVFAPLLLIFFVLFLRWAVEAFQEEKQKWIQGTRRERIIFVAAAVITLILGGILLVGDLAGWSDRI